MESKKNKFLAAVIAITLVLGAFVITGCGEKDKGDKKIKVGASPAPHAEILKEAKSELEKEGYDLEVVEFQDYVQPNKALDAGDIDANYFQHKPYMDEFNEKQGTKLVSIGTVHYEPLGLYQGTKKSIGELSEGDKIAVPNDTTNEARALLLLEAQGLIKLKKDVGLTATKQDIVENPKNLEIVELEAAVIPRSMSSVAMGVVNGNYALSAGLKEDTAIAFESSDSEAATTYANVIAVKKGNEKSEKSKALYKAITSDKVKQFIEKKYGKAVVPTF
ncbi:MAG: MetQ/NlpA family ABC transporter substrate-binding protein [Clostridiales bacterium]|nr:MetQ/NlpA family ABC transporter substrate-binding protein [Clostridiales bacterium]MDY4060962.1 MetQ/NlpA family ABC transporter substrate-binding protein [Anaerovoracaceae bacterium]